MTGFSSPVAGGGLPASALMQLLQRTGVSGLPGGLAPQVPTLPGGPRGAAGPVPPMPPGPQPPQNNMLGTLAALGGGPLGKSIAGNGGAVSGTTPWSWAASQGLFGGSGPLFGYGNVLGPHGLLENPFGLSSVMDNPAYAGGDMWASPLLAAGASGAADPGIAALGAAAASDAGLTFGSGMGLGTSALFAPLLA